MGFFDDEKFKSAIISSIPLDQPLSHLSFFRFDSGASLLKGVSRAVAATLAFFVMF